jgi:hypothetical protein
MFETKEWLGLSVPHRKHITSPLRTQQINDIRIQDIIHRVVFCLEYDVSETEFCPCLQVEPTQLGRSQNRD